MELALERKVQYYETDQMGIVHHSNYIRWFEEGRVEYLDSLGLPYKKLEDMGIGIPVLGVSCEYKLPAKFGDVACIYLEFKQLTPVKMVVSYRITNKETEVLLATGETKHCYVDEKFKVTNIQKKYPDVYEELKSKLQTK